MNDSNTGISIHYMIYIYHILSNIRLFVSLNEYSPVVNVLRLGRSIDYYMIDNILDNSRIDTSLNE